MSSDIREKDSPPRPEVESAYLLSEARGLSQRALERLRFLQNLFPADFPRAVLDQIVRQQAEAPEERRRSPRFADGPDWVIVSLSPAHGEGFRALVRDRSVGGLSLRLDWPVEVGSVLWLQPDEAVARWALLEVRHCRQHARGWLVGCEFGHPDGARAGPELSQDR